MDPNNNTPQPTNPGGSLPFPPAPPQPLQQTPQTTPPTTPSSMASNVIGPSVQIQPVTQSTPPPYPAQQPAPAPQFQPPASPAMPTDPLGGAAKNKKPFAIAMVAVLLMALGGAGYVFGFHIPNRPENVWRTGFDRSGEALDKLVDKATASEKLERLEKSKISGTLDFRSPTANVSGTLESAFSLTETDSALKLKIIPQGLSVSEELDLSAELKSVYAEGSRFPDIFFRLDNIVQVLPFMFNGADQYDGKWIAVPSEFFESMIGSQFGMIESQPGNADTPSAEDIAAIGRAVTKTLGEYVFTSDESKGVIVNRGYQGKETVDDVKAYHYKAGFSTDNLQKGCVALMENVFDVDGFDKFFGGNDGFERARKDAIDNCAMSEEESSSIGDVEFDLWIDAKYKLIHMVRFTSEETDTTFDIGQNYSGGDDISFFIRAYKDDDSVNMSATFSINFETTKSGLEITFKGKEGDDDVDLKFVLNTEPFDGDIDVSRPEGAVDIRDVINSLMSPTYPADNSASSQGSFDL